MKDSNRYEVKFVLNENSIGELLFWLQTAGFIRAYDDRKINSIYFDDVDCSAIKENLSGISNRQKIRLRWYGDTGEGLRASPFLEIKIRDGRLGRKQRYEVASIYGDMLLEKTVSQLQNIAFDAVLQTDPNVSILYEHYIPMLLVEYERKYFESSEGIRLTIDRNISFDSIDLLKPVRTEASIFYGHRYVVELKFPPRLKKVVAEMLRTLSLTPGRHSKYVLGMSKIGYVSYI